MNSHLILHKNPTSEKGLAFTLFWLENTYNFLVYVINIFALFPSQWGSFFPVPNKQVLNWSICSLKINKSCFITQSVTFSLPLLHCPPLRKGEMSIFHATKGKLLDLKQNWNHWVYKCYNKYLLWLQLNQEN